MYTTKYNTLLKDAFSVDDQRTRKALAANQIETFELTEKIIDGGSGPIITPYASPKFFPTAEGFYDFENYKYIYQYKDHLGNVRLSYSYNSSEDKIDNEDTNNYYPFGLNFITDNTLISSVYSP